MLIPYFHTNHKGEIYTKSSSHTKEIKFYMLKKFFPKIGCVTVPVSLFVGTNANIFENSNKSTRTTQMVLVNLKNVFIICDKIMKIKDNQEEFIEIGELFYT